MEVSRDKDEAGDPRRRGWANIALALLIAVTALLGVLRWVAVSHPGQTGPVPTTTADFPVTISGAVENPGTFQAREGDRLSELIIMAGGFADGADTEAVDPTLPLRDDTGEINIPFSADYEKPQKPPEPRDVDFPLNINLADELELQALPGIGPVLAARIVAYREEYGPFKKNSDLMNVEGIGRKKYDELLGLISVGKELPWEQ